VVSGFLITTHLLTHPPERFADLMTFWWRRVRRLLPASLLVVMTALVMARLFVPPQEARFGGVDGVFRILYLQNWQLAEHSDNPLTAAQIPPVVQHFWSLSLEEQFYFVWPVLLLAGMWLAVRKGLRFLPLAMWLMGAVVVASLTFSILYTPTNPSQAYFATPTRTWELAAGGLLAGLVLLRGERGARPLSDRSRDLLAWVGYGFIALTLLTFDHARPFPGWIALLPVLATIAIIAANREDGINPNRLLQARPVQYVGDLSYSIYLWHVPLIQTIPHITGRELTTADNIAIIVLSLLLASLTKHQVEDRFRYGGRHTRKPRPVAAPVRPLPGQTRPVVPSSARTISVFAR
jgi:peptidoglycan/LPS O-acetylase OafA/YrhL